MNNSLVSGSSHTLLYELRFFFNFIHYSSTWYPFSISYTVNFLISSLNVIATTLGVFFLIADIFVLVEDELYECQDKESATVLSVPLIYLMSKLYCDMKSV